MFGDSWAGFWRLLLMAAGRGVKWAGVFPVHGSLGAAIEDTLIRAEARFRWRARC